MGAGPMTGRGMGICAGNINTGFGRGCGRGRGMGMGRGLGFRAASAQPVEKTTRIQQLKQQQDAIQQQIDALEGQE
jgi:hypothetical protein